MLPTPVQILKYAVLIILIDIPWLLLAGPVAQKMILKIQGSPIVLRVLPAILVYVFLAYLLTLPGSTLEAFLLGASVYGVYDFTNYSTIKNYCPKFAVADTIWGGVLMTIAYIVKKKFKL